MNVNIRNAAESDIAAVTELGRQLGYRVTEQEIRERLKYFTETQEHVILVAESEGGEVLGWINISVCRILVEPVQIWVSGLVVHQDYRSRGIGEMLISAAENWARERQCSLMTVKSNVIRKDAHRFYHRLGFHTEKTQLSLKKSLRSASEPSGSTKNPGRR